MIVWIASYPKSGNTLLRSILGTYFFSDNGDFDFQYTYRIGQFPRLDFFEKAGIDIKNDKQIFTNYVKAQKLLNQTNKSVKFFKTHSAYFDRKSDGATFSDLDNTLGAIYIVRDPRNVVISYSHHFQVTLDEATKRICTNDLFIRRTEILPETFISSWKLNYLSWSRLGKRVLLVKYEDLVKNKKKTMLKIFKFFETLGMNKASFDISKLNKIIKATEFDKMKDLENKQGFTEAMIDDDTGKRRPFFNLGPNNKWQNLLDEKNKSIIEKTFEAEMIKLGYLTI